MVHLAVSNLEKEKISRKFSYLGEFESSLNLDAALVICL
jgi:hypothetical protein